MECQPLERVSSSLSLQSLQHALKDPELVPLDEVTVIDIGGRSIRRCSARNRNVPSIAASWRGPLRALKFLLVAAFLPAMLIAVPLYLRYFVYSGQLYPVGMSDMRMIDKKVSTTWCQKQLVHSNATFNAYLMSSQPSLSSQLVPVSMTRELSLEDDMKEYWGFYLLQGSIVTVSTCVRWPGASLIMIRGHKHLQECAYIGDDSSEELDEILMANGGRLDNATIDKLTNPRAVKPDGVVNRPDDMMRHLSGIQFHLPRMSTVEKQAPAHSPSSHSDEKDSPDPKVLKMILSQLHDMHEANKKSTKQSARQGKPKHIINVPELTHRHRDTNINEEEGKWLTFRELEEGKKGDDSIDEKAKEKMNGKLTEKTNKTVEIYEVESHNRTKGSVQAMRNLTESKKEADIQELLKTQNETNTKLNDMIYLKTDASYIENEKAKQMIVNDDIDETKKELEKNDGGEEKGLDIADEGENAIEDAQPSSSEIFEDFYQKLTSLGKRGENILQRLNERLINEKENKTTIDQNPAGSNETLSSEQLTTEESEEEEAEKKIEALRMLLQEIVKEQKNIKKDKTNKRGKDVRSKRRRRDILLQPALQDELNEHDEKGNAAIEEGFEPDGYAEHHSKINETTPNDMSRSEFWSSFSSSEEALLECDGLILNLPLTPHHSCVATSASEKDHRDVSRANTVTYRVPSNGYYFFVFNSENEVQTNYIRVRFDLQKTIYDLTNGTVMECKNSSTHCAMPLAFFSSEKVVLEVPVRNNDSLWNEEFVVISECEPRTSIYLACVIAVPIFIMVIAFQ